jgi:hypothetical protein
MLLSQLNSSEKTTIIITLILSITFIVLDVINLLKTINVSITIASQPQNQEA